MKMQSKQWKDINQLSNQYNRNKKRTKERLNKLTM